MRRKTKESGSGRSKSVSDPRVIVLKSLTQGAWSFRFVNANFDRPSSSGIDRHAGHGHCLSEKDFHIGGTAERLTHSAHFGGDKFGLECVLGVTGTAGLLL